MVGRTWELQDVECRESLVYKAPYSYFQIFIVSLNVASTVHINRSFDDKSTSIFSSCSGLIQIRFVAADLIRKSFTLCVLDSVGGSVGIKRWKIHGCWGRGESRPCIELLHWCIMLTRAARGTAAAHWKDNAELTAFPFHAWKQNAGSNSFCWFLWCLSYCYWWVCEFPSPGLYLCLWAVDTPQKRVGKGIRRLYK